MIPDYNYFYLELIQDAFFISIIVFASSISVADLYAKKHKYTINSNRVNLVY